MGAFPKNVVHGAAHFVGDVVKGVEGFFAPPPKLPELPAAPPSAPDAADEAVRAAGLAERNKQLAGRGRRSTFLTGQGVDAPAPTTPKTFLGG